LNSFKAEQQTSIDGVTSGSDVKDNQGVIGVDDFKGVTDVKGVTYLTSVTDVDEVTFVAYVKRVKGVKGVTDVKGVKGVKGVTDVKGVNGVNGVKDLTCVTDDDEVTFLTEVKGFKAVTDVTEVTEVANEEQTRPFDGHHINLNDITVTTPVQRRNFDFQAKEETENNESFEQQHSSRKRAFQINASEDKKDQFDFVTQLPKKKRSSIVPLDFEADQTSLAVFQNKLYHQNQLHQQRVSHFSGQFQHQQVPSLSGQFHQQKAACQFSGSTVTVSNTNTNRQHQDRHLMSNLSFPATKSFKVQYRTEQPDDFLGRNNCHRFSAWNGNHFFHQPIKEETQNETRTVFPSTSSSHINRSSEFEKSENQTEVKIIQPISDNAKIFKTATGKEIQRLETEQKPFKRNFNEEILCLDCPKIRLESNVDEDELSSGTGESSIETCSLNSNLFQTEGSTNQPTSNEALQQLNQRNGNTSSSLQSKLNKILDEFAFLTGRIDSHSETAKKIFELHHRKSSIDKLTIVSHLNIIRSTITDFAKSQTMFASLSTNDQNVLLETNIPLYIQYILARYFSSESGLEQMAWLMEGQISVGSIEDVQNLHYIGLREFNAKTEIIQSEMLEKVYKRHANNVADFYAFPQQCNGLIASLLIYR
jgi:hypothetical protein